MERPGYFEITKSSVAILFSFPCLVSDVLFLRSTCFKTTQSPEKHLPSKSINDENNFDQRKLEVLFSNFMFACKEPFVLVENEHFRIFLNALRPEFVIPNRKKIASSLLNSCFDALVDENREKNKENATLMLDAWTNSATNSKIMTSMVKIRSSGKEMVIKAVEVSGETLNSDKVSELQEDAVQIAENKFNLKIDSVLSDNDATMRKAGKDSMLIDYGCLSHEGNLFMKDVHSEKIYESAHSTMVEFKGHMKLHDKLLKLGGKKLYIKGQTR